MNDRALARHSKLIAFKQELLDMLGGCEPDYMQAQILRNIDDRIRENATIQQSNPFETDGKTG